ncbi:MAG: agmatine deiminase [Oscillospiraceae bacterium]|nr:agmatine deiminase [Oscillospiraceae bacterium]
MAKRLSGTPKRDGYRMPGEFETQKQVWMLWPERPDVWRNGGKSAQAAYAEVARVISGFEPVTVLASAAQYANARERLGADIRVIECSMDDAWIRDTGPSFLIDGRGGVRAADWRFNAYGGLADGLYFPWDADDAIARKVCEIENIDSYRTDDFVLEGGSIHVDGEGTLLTTEMCLLSEGRNPHMSREEIERTLRDYLNVEKIIWIKDGIDPDETTGHVDDVACFVRPGEVACIWTDDAENPFYEQCQAAYRTLSAATDAKGRALRVWKLTMPKKPTLLRGAETIDRVDSACPREDGEICIASYMNFLIVNGGVIVPQYGDEYDALALEQIQEMFPERRAVGVYSTEIVYGGGNIHCITQQQPRG